MKIEIINNEVVCILPKEYCIEHQINIQSFESRTEKAVEIIMNIIDIAAAKHNFHLDKDGVLVRGGLEKNGDICLILSEPDLSFFDDLFSKILGNVLGDIPEDYDDMYNNPINRNNPLISGPTNNTPKEQYDIDNVIKRLQNDLKNCTCHYCETKKKSVLYTFEFKNIDEVIKAIKHISNKKESTLYKNDNKYILHIENNNEDEVKKDVTILSEFSKMKMISEIRLAYFKEHCELVGKGEFIEKLSQL